MKEEEEEVVVVVEDEEERKVIQSKISEEGKLFGLFSMWLPGLSRQLRARPRYPGVEDLFRRATFLRETHPYPSMLLYCQVK